jgi:hypothetical protein
MSFAITNGFPLRHGDIKSPEVSDFVEATRHNLEAVLVEGRALEKAYVQERLLKSLASPLLASWRFPATRMLSNTDHEEMFGQASSDLDKMGLTETVCDENATQAYETAFMAAAKTEGRTHL